MVIAVGNRRRFLPVRESLAAACDLDDLSVAEGAVQNGSGDGHIAQQLAPVFERTIAGHQRRLYFVATMGDFEQLFSQKLGQLLHFHVIDDQQIRLHSIATGNDLSDLGLLARTVFHWH